MGRRQQGSRQQGTATPSSLLPPASCLRPPSFAGAPHMSGKLDGTEMRDAFRTGSDVWNVFSSGARTLPKGREQGYEDRVARWSPGPMNPYGQRLNTPKCLFIL